MLRLILRIHMPPCIHEREVGSSPHRELHVLYDISCCLRSTQPAPAHKPFAVLTCMQTYFHQQLLLVVKPTQPRLRMSATSGVAAG